VAALGRGGVAGGGLGGSHALGWGLRDLGEELQSFVQDAMAAAGGGCHALGGAGVRGGVCVEAVKGEIERLERVAEDAQVRP
jgi:hypothetical protein